MENEKTMEIKDRDHLMAACEAMLFATGRAVESEEIARALGTGVAETRTIMAETAKRWNERSGGTEMISLDDSWQLCTRKDYYPELIALEIHPRKPRLTDVLLETLSVIAYRQPVTKGEIERIRGVSSDHAVNRLVELSLVEEVGRAKQPGRPILFGTTKDFLRAFGVSSKGDLPEMDPLRMADIEAEAAAEAGSLDGADMPLPAADAGDAENDSAEDVNVGI